MPSERAFVTSAIQGIAIAMTFALFVMIIATHNLILSLMSIVCVAFVICSVVAIMQMKGWELGVAESICIVILIGFSVDYVVHLAADFKHSSKQTRSEKMKQAYKEMGVSIFSGTITTFGCGAFLFGGNITLFSKFAVLITSTISISFLTAMLLFGALCHTIGPEEDTGSVTYCCKRDKNRHFVEPPRR